MSFDTGRPTRSGFLLGGWLALSVLALACGNKELPQPPPQMIAAQTTDLTIQQRGNEFILSFTYPTTTIAGFPLGPLQAVEIWELAQELEPEVDSMDADLDEEPFDPLAETPDSAPAPPPADERPESRIQADEYTFSSLGAVRATLSDAELTSAIAGEKIVTRMTFDDEHVAGETGLVYAVKTISERGLASGYSNLVVLARRETPPAPAPFVVEPGPDWVALFWGEQPEAPTPSTDVEAEDEATAEGEAEPEEDTTGEPAAEEEEEEDEEEDDGVLAYRIYRRDAHVRDYGEPLREVPPEIGSLFDTSPVLGNSYIYAVTAVIETRPLVETALSVEREVDYQDRFAPLPPTNVVVLIERDSVRLLWDASRGDDVLGYFVLRAEGDGEFVQLNEEPIEVLEFVDTDLTSRRTYRYTVEAIDQTGNRGEPSREIQAQIP